MGVNNVARDRCIEFKVTMRLLLVFYPTLRASPQDPEILSQNTCAAPGLRPALFAPSGAVWTPCDGVQTHWASERMPIGHALQLAGAV